MTTFLRKYSKKPRALSEIKKTGSEDDRSNITFSEVQKSTKGKSNLKHQDVEISIVSEVDLKSVFKEYMAANDKSTCSQIVILPESVHLTVSDTVMHSDLLTNMLGCIIRYAGNEINLVRTKYSTGKAEIFYNLDDFTLEEKCTKPMFELHDYPTYLLGKDEMAYSFYKFEVDKCFIEKLLMNMARAIMKKKSYSGFLNVLKNLLNSKQEEDEYLNESYQNKTDINNIEKTRYEEKSFNKKEMDAVDDQLANYKNMFEDINRENAIKEEYIDKWEKSRNRQNRVMYRQRIEKLEREIKEHRSKIDRENRVNEEVERYTQMVHVDTEKELESWSERYDNELEQKEYEIQSLQETTLNLSEKLALLKQQFEHQCKCIEEWRKLREELIRRKELAACQEIAAIKIQAWWRGVRIRKGIGLKKKKKKRGGKKEEKKGRGAPAAAKGKK